MARAYPARDFAKAELAEPDLLEVRHSPVEQRLAGPTRFGCHGYVSSRVMAASLAAFNPAASIVR